ncbi:cohesin domain-containing protein [Methanosarcina siciliae]|uniref:cohesin domain-containing protein n=1 Tax=Methanosarcina siciliae TaxID=38027 RepID=UPI000AE49825|nr:cohesin domain-containing protein [Methanosarcina siciliae]
MFGNSRKICIWLFAIIAALSIFSSNAAAASEVILRPSAGTNWGDNPVTLDIFVVPDTDVAGMQFDLKFNESLLQVTNVTEGDLFEQSGMETYFNTGKTDAGALKNTYGCILGKGEVSTPGTFATVTLSLTSNKNIMSEIYLENVIISSPEGNAVEIKVKNHSAEPVETKDKTEPVETKDKTEPVETKDRSSSWKEIIYNLLEQLV